MTFYFKPPRGRIEIDKMVDSLQQRLEFITAVSEHSESYRAPQNLSYFAEGTAIDRASHYLLRLLSIKPTAFQEHVIHAETALFHKRLDFSDKKHYKIVLQTSRQHIEEIITTRDIKNEKYLKFLDATKNICDDMLSNPENTEHAFSQNHETSCDCLTIKVPYRICLKMVANRKVHIKDGVATVPCGLWKRLLIEVFRLHLTHGYEDMVLSGCHLEAINDPRIFQLSKLLLFSYKKLDEKSGGDRSLAKTDLTCANIIERQKMFPPCIISMLQALFSQHRIGHHARVALTFQLRECGMPVKEALKFWKSELSKPEHKHNKHGSSCCHSWQKDERKYTYSIRHMYGLEGSRNNYPAASCSTMQGKLLAPEAVGGCPFSRLPDEKLSNFLNFYGCYDQSKILKLAQEGKPLKACQQLLLSQLNNVPKKNRDELPNTKFTKPSQFYSIYRDWSLEF